MLSVEAARERILSALAATSPEVVGLADAWNRVTAYAVTARLDQPPYDVSAMDGYAVQAGDAPGSALRVVGSAPAGKPWSGRLEPGQALRLFTGSVVPQGADAILLQEDAEAADGLVRPKEAAVRGRHIRRAGQDFTRGEVLVAAGRRMTARDVGLVASGNHPWVSVHRRPRVAILATGDEIALPGEAIPDGGIISSNAHVLAAMMRAGGGEPTILPIAGDDLDALGQAADAASGFDLLVTTGGASVGDHDLVQQGFRRRGMELDFWKVAMRPGKPLMHGRLGRLPVLGLPGNPVSCFVTAFLFALPAIRRLGGETRCELDPTLAMLDRDLPANDHRADHLRARLSSSASGGLTVSPFEKQDSGQLRVLATAEALLLRPPHAPPARAGELVPILALDRLGL